MSAFGDLEKLIHELEHVNQQFVKQIEKEKQLIEALEVSITEKKSELSQVLQSTAHLDEETKRVHKQFTQNRDNCNSLRKTSAVLCDHEAALTKTLDALVLSHKAEKAERKSVLSRYQGIWDDYKAKYESFKLAKELKMKQDEITKLEEEKQGATVEINHLQEKIRLLSGQDEAGDFTPYEDTNKYVIALAEIKRDSSMCCEEVEKKYQALNEVITETQRIKEELDCKKKEEAARQKDCRDETLMCTSESRTPQEENAVPMEESIVSDELAPTEATTKDGPAPMELDEHVGKPAIIDQNINKMTSFTPPQLHQVPAPPEKSAPSQNPPVVSVQDVPCREPRPIPAPRTPFLQRPTTYNMPTINRPSALMMPKMAGSLQVLRPAAPAPRTPIIPMPSSSRTIERHMLPRTPIPPLQQSSRLTMGQAMARSYVPLPPSRYPVTVGPKTPVAVSQTTGSTFVNQTESTYSFPSSTQGSVQAEVKTTVQVEKECVETEVNSSRPKTPNRDAKSGQKTPKTPGTPGSSLSVDSQSASPFDIEKHLSKARNFKAKSPGFTFSTRPMFADGGPEQGEREQNQNVADDFGGGFFQTFFGAGDSGMMMGGDVMNAKNQDISRNQTSTESSLPSAPSNMFGSPAVQKDEPFFTSTSSAVSSPTPAFNFAGGAGSGTGGSSMFAMFGGSEEPSQVENTQGQGDFNFSFGGGPASPVVSGGSAGFSLF